MQRRLVIIYLCDSCAHYFVMCQTAGVVRKEPLSHRQVLVILENLYDLVLEVEQLRRDQPSQEEEEAYQFWSVHTILLFDLRPEDKQGEVVQ